MPTSFPSSRAISPSVRIVERDYSQYFAGDDSNTTALVGFAAKGPLNVPTRVLNTEELYRLFGAPDPNVPSHLLYAATDYLREGNDLYLVRVGQDDPGSADFARSAFVDVPSGGSHARIISGKTAADWKGTPSAALVGDRFIRVRANGQPYIRTLVIPDGTVVTNLVDTGSGTSLETLLNDQLTEDDGFEVTHAGSGSTARLVFRSRVNGPTSKIELVSSRYNIYNGATGAGLTQSNTDATDTTDGTYMCLDIGQGMTSPMLEGTATAFGSSTAGTWDFSGYRNLRLEVQVYGTGDPDTDGVIQVVYLPRDATTGDNLSEISSSPITTAVLVDYLNGTLLASPVGGSTNAPRGFYFQADTNTINIIAGYPSGNIASGGGAATKGWFLTGSEAKLVVRPQSTADEMLGLDGVAAIGTDPSVVTVNPTSDTPSTDAKAASAIIGSDTSSDIPALRLQSATPGTEGNYISVTVSTDPDTGKLSLFVDHRGKRMESWTQLHLNPNSVTDSVHYVENYINGYSDFISVVHDPMTDDLPKAGSYTLGSLDLTQTNAGTNGIPVDPQEQADLIVGSTVRSSGIFSLSEPERIEIDLVAVPGVSTTSVIDAMRYLCEDLRGDCMFIVDPPFGMTPTEVRKWHNGQHPLNSTKFNSNYGAMYWPWIKEFDAVNGTDVWVPPSGSVLAVYARTDKNAGPWFAPAGLNRGKIAWAKETEYVPYLTERDSLYSFDNAVNCLSLRPGQGIVIWGQKTLQRAPTALDRVSVRRMLLYAEKSIKEQCYWLLFEPHDDVLRRNFKAIVDTVMQKVIGGRGAYEYQVECDEVLNPDEVVQRNEFRARIRIRPAKTAEFFFLEFALFRKDNFNSVITDATSVRYR